ncbi:RrF2 family transcriptional regulator [Actibacterium lipolyticum]|uniref:HTH-type transcriptional repressor NsrR n=1 Tax=Actibacterium lipolyticum TaxID=1524263 RepID=A0A238KN36_9RHOB|nr:Rrf2 family transcriptional regulator [Actibacterium lipolyticum]SMX43602.1 HTH-type transcriptional repressor NsrR [Actibacterium lipolyticum]
MRLTTRTNLAARILMACADNPGRLLKTAEVANLCNCSINHTAHVVQRLQAEGYVSTIRGRAGGFALARHPEEVSIGGVFRVFEGDIPFAECFDEKTNTCPLHTACRLRRYIERALDAFYHELDLVTLHDLVQGNCGLSALLSLKPEMPDDCRP